MSRKRTISDQSGKTSSTQHRGGALKVEQAPIADIRPNPKDARRHGPKQIGHLTAIVGRVGFVQPVLINQHNVLIAGHGRLEAALRLGLLSIPAIRLSHSNEAEFNALALADNRVTELATWVEEQLKVVFEDLIIEDLDFSISDVSGFDAPMINPLRPKPRLNRARNRRLVL